MVKLFITTAFLKAYSKFYLYYNNDPYFCKFENSIDKS